MHPLASARPGFLGPSFSSNMRRRNTAHRINPEDSLGS
jgi:hypothetical protein